MPITKELLAKWDSDIARLKAESQKLGKWMDEKTTLEEYQKNQERKLSLLADKKRGAKQNDD